MVEETLHPRPGRLRGRRVSLSGRTETRFVPERRCDNVCRQDGTPGAAGPRALSGPGEAAKAGSSIGLANVQRRILLQYWCALRPVGGTARRGRGTCISIARARWERAEGGLARLRANNRGRRDPGGGHAGKNGGLGGRGLSACGCLRQWTGPRWRLWSGVRRTCVHRFPKCPSAAGLEFIDGVHALGLALPHRCAQRFR